MIDLRIDGQSVDLQAGSSLDLTLINPHFDYSKLVGSSANLPTFPLTRRNQQIFGYWDQPQAGGILQKRELAQFYNGHLIREATFLLTEAGPNGYTGQAVEALGEFFGDWQNRLLSELDMGTIELPAVVTPTLQDFMQPALVFPTLINPDFYGTNGPAVGYSGRVNDYTDGQYENTPARPLVPMVMLNWLLLQIAAKTGTVIEGNFLTHPAYSSLLVYNTRALDGRTSVVINQHLPDLTLAEWFLELRKLFNLRLDIDAVRRRMTIGFWQEAIGPGAALDWSKKAVGKAVKTPEVNTRLQLSYELDGGDGLMKDKPAELADYLTPGSSSLASLKSKISTLLVDETSRTARAAQAGVTQEFGQLTQRFAPRLLFWLGMGVDMPQAGPVKGNYSLFWNGEKGLVAHHWGELEKMRQVQYYVKQALDLNETDLAHLDWSEKVHINGVDYFLLSVAVSLPIKKPADCLLVAA